MPRARTNSPGMWLGLTVLYSFLAAGSWLLYGFDRHDRTTYRVLMAAFWTVMAVLGFVMFAQARRARRHEA